MYLKKERTYVKYLFICWLVIVVIKMLTDSIIAPGLIWSVVFILGVVAFPKFRLNISLPHQFWCLFLLYMLCDSCINYLLNPDFYVQPFPKLIFELVFVYLLPLCVSFTFHNCKKKEVFFKLFRNFMICCSFLGIFEYVTKNQFYTSFFKAESILFNFERYGDISLPSYRMFLFFFHPIYYAVLQICGLVCLVYLPLKNKMLHYVACILIILNILLTQSRTGWLLIVLLFFLYFSKYAKYKISIGISSKNLFFILFLLCLAAVAIVVFLKSEFYLKLKEMIILRLEAIIVHAEFGARLSNISLIRELAEEKGIKFYLFGGGFRFSISYLQSHPTTMGWVRAIDNEYLTILMDGGIFGLLFLMVFVISCIVQYYKKRVEKSEDIPYLVCILVFIAGLFFEPIGGNIIFYFLMLIIGLMEKSTLTLQKLKQLLLNYKGEKI